MKKSIFIFGVSIILILIISAVFVLYKDDSVTIKDTISFTNTVCTILDQESTEKITEKSNSLKQSDTAYLINDIPVKKMDIEVEQNKISNLSEENKDILCKNESAIIETTKQIVAQQEAIKLGYKISDSQKETFKNIAEKLYENSDKIISKEEYVDTWTAIQERDELASLFMADTMKKIALNEFSCDNEKVMNTISDFHNDKTAKNLNLAYNEYLMYLITKYNIQY